MPDSNSVANGASSEYFEWTFPGAPLRIRLPLASIAAMREYLLPNSPAEEAGGVLLGRTEGNCVEITGFVPFACGPEAKPLFALSQDDRPRFQALLDRCNRPGGAARAVGYFRSQIGDELRLEERDLPLIHDCFQDPLSVYLIVQIAGEGGSPTAGFFFRDGGEVFTAFTLMPFPFQERLLAAAEMPPPREAAAAVPDAAPPRPSASGARRVSLLAPGIAAALILCSAALYWAEVRRPVAVAPAPAPPQVPPARARTDLAVGGAGPDLRIRWNPDAQGVKDARVGLLIIQDGALKKEVPLTPAMLRDSSVAYTVKTDRVDVALELYMPNGRRTRDEVIFLSGPPAPVTPNRSSAPADAGRLSRAVPELHARQAEPVRPFSLPRLPAVPPQHATTTLATPPLVPGLPGASPSGSPPEILKQIAANAGPHPPQPAPPPREVRAAPPRTALPHSGRVAVRMPPRPVQQTSPELPANVSRLLAREVHVRVKVTVDARGKVVDAQPLSVNGALGAYLGSVAAAAARLWRFDPARVDRKPVPGDVILEFVFAPQKSPYMQERPGINAQPN